MSELKRCPFCGSEAILEMTPFSEPKESIRCSNDKCFMCMGAEAKYVNSEEWNTRINISPARKIKFHKELLDH